MALNENGGEFISLSEAQGYVSAFRKLNPTAIKGYFAGGENIQKILAQDGCIGIRLYNGYDTSGGKTNLVIVGVDEAENDMTEGLILEKLGMCPPFCSPTSALYNL